MEADSEFACMDAMEYKRIQEKERNEQYEIFMGYRFDETTCFKQQQQQQQQIKQNVKKIAGKENDDDDKDDEIILAYEDQQSVADTINTEDDEDDDNDEDEDEDDSIMGLLGFGNNQDNTCINEDDDTEPSPPPRMFMMIWNAISQWITPDAVSYIKYFHNEYHFQQEKEQCDEYHCHPTFDIPFHIIDTVTEITLSRCGALMTMMKPYINQCLIELQYYHTMSIDIRHIAEMKLSTFLRCLNYEQSCPIHFDSITTPIVTCILLDIVLMTYCKKKTNRHHENTNIIVDDDDNNNHTTIEQKQQQHTTTTTTTIFVPDICVKAGMLREEYKYLTQSAILNSDMDAFIHS
jgi:hypothetical protein